MAAATLTAAVLFAPTTTAAPPGDPVPSVIAAMPAGASPKVTITRSADGWAFGTAVAHGAPGTDKMPDGWLFLAERTPKGWRAALDGQQAFAELAAKSPLVNVVEKPLFAKQNGTQAGGDFRTGMALPWATGQTWAMPGGPHGWAGAPRPWSSLDLAGGDQRVRAVRAGTAYTMCKGWVRVIHDRGYATDYYHLWNNINVNGVPVAAGAYLGDTGTDVTCGGSALGRHVHFALRQNSAYVDIAGHSIGKWTPANGGAAYQGSALHGSARVYPGGSLYNYGALGFTQGVVDTNGGGSVNKRSGPGTGYGVVGSVTDGATVTVSCSANGTSHTGRYGSTSLWNRLSDGTWMSDAFLWTGVNGPVAGNC
ncbi:peptidoglycan DD-metalloendopeptidase family protein [Actinokineospora guangxiensis]|uniref:Peptidoglycan DD-metalloendopeptidase family protein n=1 Tax=Actinokineospora guangxiensis TaxID=1490288 RepID=A0ABW0EN13_9PSEU